MKKPIAKKVTPEMFFSDVPPERIIGVECEYNLQCTDSDGVSHEVSEYISRHVMEKAGIHSMNGYTDRGSRIYRDVNHAEYCTPECLGPYQAAAADLAGISVLSSIIEASGIEHRGLFRISGSTLKDETSVQKSEFTSGVHENFMAPRVLAHDPLLEKLLPTYYAVRLAAMAGNVSSNQYEFSQKVNGIGEKPIEREYRRHTSRGVKPMAFIQNTENDKIDIGWMLLETRYADAPMSLASRRHALGSTSLLLRMLEHQHIYQASTTHNDFDDIILSHPVMATHKFMSDLTLKKTAYVESGKRMSMLDINEKLVEKALYLSQKIMLPIDEQNAITTWGDINDAFRRSNPARVEYDPYLVREFSVATKHYWLNRIGAFAKGDAEAKTRSLQWDRVLPAGNGRQLMEKMTANDAEVEKLKTTPPPTRAAIRAEYIAENHEHIRRNVTGWNIKKERGELGSSYEKVSPFSDAYGFIQ